MARNLSKVLQEMAAAETILKTDLSSVKAKMRASHAIAATDAEVHLKTLREEFVGQVRERACTIFVVGTQAQKDAFAKIAEKEGETLTLDADEIYQKMAEDVEPTIGAQRQFGGTQLQHLIRTLETQARRCGAEFLQTPRLMDVVIALPPDSDKPGPKTVDIIKEIVSTQVGVGLNVKWLEARFAEEAIARKYDHKVLPAVIFCSDPEEVKTLQSSIYGGRGIIVTFGADEVVTDATVLQAFNLLRERLKKQ